MAVKWVKVKCTDNVLSVKPQKVKVRVNKPNGQPDDTCGFQSGDADLDILFNKGSQPWGWASKTVPQGAAGVDFGPPSNKQKLEHAYTLVIRKPGQAAITIDPTVEVESGPPPSGGKKKAAKKAAKKKAMKKRAMKKK